MYEGLIERILQNNPKSVTLESPDRIINFNFLPEEDEHFIFNYPSGRALSTSPVNKILTHDKYKGETTSMAFDTLYSIYELKEIRRYY